MINTQAQLCDFLRSIKDETELAIDTEFKWVSTYYPILCLIQIATKNRADCIDVLSIKNLQPLFDRLYQKDCLWIAHAVRNDIEVLYRLSGQLPNQVFDTQIAVNLLNDLRPENSNPNTQMSYQMLTEVLQGVRLEKAHTRTDWTLRPLPDGAIEYALDDVRYLIKNYHQLKQRLEDEKKLHWLMEEGQSLLDVDLYETDITQAWKRVKGLLRLPKKAHTIGAQLCAWREATAQRKNKPRKWILSNDDLIKIAMKKSSLSADNQQAFEHFLTQYPQLCGIELDSKQHTPPTAQEKAQKIVLQKLIQERANQYNLNTEVITTSKTLLRYIRGDQSVNFLSGWRYQILKGEIENAK